LVEISSIGKKYEIDPLKDLVPVCPNCHHIIHRKKPAYSISEIKVMLGKK
jgi:5-methylcytosine-specific restriction protein A